MMLKPHNWNSRLAKWHPGLKLVLLFVSEILVLPLSPACTVIALALFFSLMLPLGMRPWNFFAQARLMAFVILSPLLYRLLSLGADWRTNQEILGRGAVESLRLMVMFFIAWAVISSTSVLSMREGIRAILFFLPKRISGIIAMLTSLVFIALPVLDREIVAVSRAIKARGLYFHRFPVMFLAIPVRHLASFALTYSDELSLAMIARGYSLSRVERRVEKQGAPNNSRRANLATQIALSGLWIAALAALVLLNIA